MFTGEDYYVLNKFEYTHFDDFANASSPNWLFTPFNYWNNETLMVCEYFHYI